MDNIEKLHKKIENAFADPDVDINNIKLIISEMITLLNKQKYDNIIYMNSEG